MRATIEAREFVSTVECFREVWNCSAIRFSWHSHHHFSMQGVLSKRSDKHYIATAGKHFYDQSLMVAHQKEAKHKKKCSRSMVVKISAVEVLRSIPVGETIEILFPKCKGYACRVEYALPSSNGGTLYLPPARGRL